MVLMDDLIHVAWLLAGILVAFTVVMTMVAYTVLAERRVLGFIQGRLGPNRVYSVRLLSGAGHRHDCRADDDRGLPFRARDTPANYQ